MKQKSWKWLFSTLAFLILLLITSSLFVSNKFGAHSKEVTESTEHLSELLNDLDQIRSLVSEVDKAANDVFESRKFDTEKTRMHAELEKFNGQYSLVLERIARSRPEFYSSEVREHFMGVRVRMDKMVVEEEAIFSSLRKGQPKLATEHMARMDREFAAVFDAVRATGNALRLNHLAFLKKRKADLESLRIFEVIGILFVSLMIIGLLTFGVGLSRFAADAIESERQVQEQMSALNAAAIVGITDLDGKITYANPKFETVSGYSQAELLGEDHRMLNSKYHPKSFFKEMWLTIRAGDVWHGEVKNKRKDGSEYWVDTTIVPTKNSREEVWQYVSIRQEITARKRAEAEIESARLRSTMLLEVAQSANRATTVGELLRSILEIICARNSMPIGHAYVLAGDNSGELVSSQIWHFEVGRKFEKFRQESEQSRFAPGHGMIGQVLKSRSPALFENLKQDPNFVRRKSLDGTAINFAFAMPIFVRGQVFAVLEFFAETAIQVGPIMQDLTFAISVFIDQVYRREQAAESLKHERLIAEEATKTKSNFLANMSHEIRTPMNGIIGMSNLLLGSLKDPADVDRVRIIQSCGQSLLDLINDVLDFSKLEVGKVEFEVRSFDLDLCVRDVVALLGTQANAKGLKLVYDAGRNVPSWVCGDSARIRQVLSNLISNAIKFTKSGRIEVSSFAEKQPSGQFKIEFLVKDTGIGIPLEAQKKLFQSFSQADASTTRNFGGSGLGLVICRGLVEKMGGKIWFETEAGVGSTFRFFFLAEEGHAQEQKALNPLSGFDAGFSLRHPLKILLVEDNRTNQIVALGLLDRMGYKVDVADDGFEAIHRTTESEYDLILMDCHMPGLDGFEATRQIRSRSRVGGGPRIVALTASLSEQDIESCRTSGMDGFLGKPIAISELAKVLAESRSSVVPISKVDLKDDSKLNSKPVFDRSAFELNFAGMEDLAIEAVESFLQQQVVLMAAIGQAVAAQDSKALELAAHTFKGAVSNFYAEPTRSRAQALEERGRSGHLDQVDVIQAELKTEYDKLELDLKEFVRARKAA